MINQIQKVAGVGLATSIMLAVTANNAQAFDFTFSLENVSGTTAGTVEGTIEGLSDNSTGPASAININSFPAGLGGSIEEGLNPLAWSNVANNSFTVSGGEITDFDVDTRTASGNNTFCLRSSASAACGDRFSFVSFDRASTFVRVTDSEYDADPTTISFSASSATPVPFGVSADLSLLILGGLYGASRLRKKLAK